MENLDVLIPILTTLIGSITTLGVIWYKNKLEKQRLEADHTCPIGECISEDTLVIEKLREILDETHGDRISIYSFHNGGTFYSGKSMQKMSMRHMKNVTMAFLV